MNPVYLFGIYVVTILIARIPLLFWHNHAPKIGGFQLHHYMYGLVLLVVYFLVPQNILLAVGLGLFVDELPLFFIFKGLNWPDDHWKQYHSWQSIVGIIISFLGLMALNFFHLSPTW